MRKDLDGLNLAVHRSRGETETVLGQLERRTREQSGESARQLSSMNARLDGLTAEMNRLSVRLDELAQRLDGQSAATGRRAKRASDTLACPFTLGRHPRTG